MNIMSIEEIKQKSEASLTEEEKTTLAANLAFHILYGNISMQEAAISNDEIVEMAKAALDDNHSERKYRRTITTLDDLVRMECISSKDNFSLEEFMKKSDHLACFPYECGYNKVLPKAALGLIMPEEALYCDVKVGNHAGTATTFYKMEDPKYPNLALLHFSQPEQPNWHIKVMEDKSAIIIHFMPNSYGEVIYIPEKLTEFQYNELVKINETLNKYEIISETSYEGMELASALKDETFREKHGLPRIKIDQMSQASEEALTGTEVTVGRSR